MRLPLSARGLLAAGVAAYLVFAVATFPARVALHLFAPDSVAASGVSGSVWRGEAAALQAQQLTLTDVSWKFRPLTLLTARLGYAVNARILSGAVQANAAISPDGSVALYDTAGVIPVAALAGFIPVSSVDGRIGLDLAELRIAETWLTDARGTVDLVDLTLLQPVSESLGSYALVFDGVSEEGLVGRFREVNGPLEARGTVTLHADQSWQLEGTVKARPGASSQLSRGLMMLGPRNADGSYPLVFASD